MGYGYYEDSQGRPAGYAVEDTCNADGCDKKINRGLAYMCGEDPDGDAYGCGNWFCYEHLSHFFFEAYDEDTGQYADEMSPQLCNQCGPEWERAMEEEYADNG